MKMLFPWAFLEYVGTLANSGGRYSIYVSDVRGIVAALTGNIWCYNDVTLTYKNTQIAAVFRTITYLPSYFSTPTIRTK